MKQLILLLLLLPIISAPPILTLQNEFTQPGETILATITTSGEFTAQIDKSQIKFFSGRKQTALESDILYYNSTQYLYIYTTKEENLTLQIENILYKEDGILQSATITQNLTIQKNLIINEETNETSAQILKIKPGYIFTATTPKLKLTNMGTETLNFTFNSEEVSIPPLSSQELEFTPEETFSFAEVSTYKDFKIPVVYLISEENTTFVSPTVKADLRQNPELLLVETFTENKSQETIELFNFGSDNLTNLKATSSLDFIILEDLQDMQGRGTQNLTLELKPKTAGHFGGTINISYVQNGTTNILEIPLSIFVLPKGATNESFQIIEETCEQISGQICESGTSCNGTIIFTIKSGMPESCCSDSCVQMETSNPESQGSGWLIGIVIFAALGFIGYYFYKKQKELQPQTSKDTLSQTAEKFESRIAGNPTQRTTGNLTKS